MKNRILLIILLLAVIGVIGYKIVFKDHRDINGESASFSISVGELKKIFAANDSIANATYSDKTIIVTGVITAIDSVANSIIIDGKLSAILNNRIQNEIQLQEKIKVKGRFVGYDDLVDELKMDQATIIK